MYFADTPLKKIFVFDYDPEMGALALAKSKSRQIPLGPVDIAQLPPDVQKVMNDAGEADRSAMTSVMITQRKRRAERGVWR